MFFVQEEWLTFFPGVWSLLTLSAPYIIVKSSRVTHVSQGIPQTCDASGSLTVQYGGCSKLMSRWRRPWIVKLLILPIAIHPTYYSKSKSFLPLLVSSRHNNTEKKSSRW